MVAFLGMRGTGDWATDQRPKSWREFILYLYPNGDMPMTGMLSKLREESVTDPQYYWWTKKHPDQAGAMTGLYTNADLQAGNLYSATYPVGGGGAATASTLYAKMAEASAKEFRIGHQVLIRDSDDDRVDVNAKVTARTLNGASSYLTVKTLEADDGGGVANNLTNGDRVLIIGNINEEGAAMPNSISYDPVKYNNYTQIFRTPLSITRTARKTKLRTGEAYKEMKREALELHGVEMEKAFLFGIATENPGDGGKLERTTMGVIPFVKANVSANANDFRLNSSYAGKAWLDSGGGEDWLDSFLETVFRYGSGEKLAMCGSGAILGLSRLAKAGGHITLTPSTTSYGLKIIEWITPFGVLNLKLHPLLSHEPSCRQSMIIMEPMNLKYRYIDDTMFYGEGEAKQAGPGTNNGRKDSTDEEFLTECGLEMFHPDTFMFLNGVGQDNTV